MRLIRTEDKETRTAGPRWLKENPMVIANTSQIQLRRAPAEHRTEPRILLRMEAGAGNPKLKPTLFLPSTLLRFPERPNTR